MRPNANLNRLLNRLTTSGKSGFWVYLLISGSGLASLIYEIIWIRQASLVFGSSSLALSTVLAVFFLGLGLGSYGFGRLSLKIRQPLLWCAGLECLLALNGLINPGLFNTVDALYGQVYRRFFDADANQLIAFRAMLVTLVLLPPSLLMGGTLPLFCKQLIHDTGQFSTKLSYIYGFNTLGAALGCLLTGFVLLPKFGLSGSLQIAVTLNLCLGFGLWCLHRLHKHSPVLSQPTPAYHSATLSGLLPIFLVGLLFFMIGAAALANELIWARFLTHFVRNSVYTYSLALGVVLIGTALGSFWLGPKFDQYKTQRNLVISFALFQAASALLTQVLTHLPYGFWQALKALGILPFMLVMLPPAIIAGASFPLLNRLATQSAQYAHSVGRYTGLNIFGCIVGSLLTGYVLLPHYGLDASISTSTTLSMGCAILALGFGVDWTIPANRPKPMLYIGAYGLLMLWLGLLIFPPQQIPQEFIAAEEQLIDMTEGYNANLAVVMRNQEKTLLVDRLWQGIATKNYQIMVAHVPMLHYPDAKDVLVVGLGAGTTASRFLYYPISHLHIVDIEPRLFEFTRKHFPSAWMDDARVKLLPEDGRNYIKHTKHQYDLVSVEIGQPDRPGVGVFYTHEFYENVSAHLQPGGMVSQFVPLAFLRPAEFAGIIKTFLATFPNSQLWYNTEELLLMGFKGEIRRLSPKTFADAIANPIIKADIAINYWGGSRYNINQFPAFLSGFLASGAELQALANSSPAEIYSDDKLQLSYSVNNSKRTDQRSLHLVPHLQKNLSNFAAAVQPGSTDPLSLQSASQIRDLNVGDIAAFDLLNQINQTTTAQTAYSLASRALQWNPRSIDAQVRLQNAQVELDQERAQAQH